MAKRTVVLDTGSGADQAAVTGTIKISPFYPHADGNTLIHASEKLYPLSLPATSVSLTVGEYFWFIPVQPKGEPILAQIPAGGGDLLYKDLVPLDPSTMDPAELAQPAWQDAIDAVTPTLDGLPITVYGDSYTVRNLSSMTSGHGYYDQTGSELGSGTVTTYGVSGVRIDHTVSAMINEAGMSTMGLPAAVAGSTWPSVSSRPGLVVFDLETNDVGHYTTGSSDPVAISGAGGTRYLSGIRGLYRAALAIASSQYRIENNDAAVTYGGTWGADTALAFAPASGGNFASSTAVGGWVQFAVPASKIPQSGALAGKVFLIHCTFDSAILPNETTVNVSIDGGTASPWTTNGWEQYDGTRFASWAAIPVTLPVDGAAHTVRFTKTTSGAYFMPDFLACPSINPGPALVMQAPKPEVNAGLWNAAKVDIWSRNFAQIDPIIQAVVAEFPHAHCVPTTMTANGLYSLDGLHPNDRGMLQRKNDLVQAIRTYLSAYLRNRVAETTPDSDFTTL